MRVVVDMDRCEANGLCTVAAPDVFEMVEQPSGLVQVHVIVAEPSSDRHTAVQEAARFCPVQAISLEDEA